MCRLSIAAGAVVVLSACQPRLQDDPVTEQLDGAEQVAESTTGGFGYAPQFAGEAITAAAAQGLADEELVVGVVSEGQARAYPLRLLSFGEHLNDRVGTDAVCATW